MGLKGPKTLDSKQQQSYTQRTTIDPTLRQRQDHIWDTARGITDLAYQPYTGQRFEGFTPDQLASFDAARGAAGAGRDVRSHPPVARWRSARTVRGARRHGALGGVLAPPRGGNRAAPSRGDATVCGVADHGGPPGTRFHDRRRALVEEGRAAVAGDDRRAGAGRVLTRRARHAVHGSLSRRESRCPDAAPNGAAFALRVGDPRHTLPPSPPSRAAVRAFPRRRVCLTARAGHRLPRTCGRRGARLAARTSCSPIFPPAVRDRWPGAHFEQW